MLPSGTAGATACFNFFSAHTRAHARDALHSRASISLQVGRTSRRAVGLGTLQMMGYSRANDTCGNSLPFRYPRRRKAACDATMTPGAAAAAGESACWWKRGSGDGVWVGCGGLQEKALGASICVEPGGYIGGGRRELELQALVIVVVVEDGSQNRSLPVASLDQIRADASLAPLAFLGCNARRSWVSSVNVFPLFPSYPGLCSSSQ